MNLTTKLQDLLAKTSLQVSENQVNLLIQYVDLYTHVVITIICDYRCIF